MNRKAVFGAVLSILTLYKSAHAQLIFPHFAQGGGYQTTFTLTNLSQTPATATVQVILQSGAPATNLVIPLTPNGSGTASLAGAGLTVGWARVSLSPPVSATGFETIQLINDAGVIADASVLPVIPTASAQFPVVQRNGVATGLAFANSGTTSATVNLALRDQSGAVIGTQTLSIGPSQQMARFITEFFHGIGAFDGSIQVSSSPPIAIVGLKQLPSGIFSTLPSGLPPGNSPESLFSPGGGIAARIVQEIQRAVTSIDIAIYTFTETEIADALIAAKNRGVSIRIIADAGEASVTGSAIGRLEHAGFPVKRTEGIGTGIMHNKYAIFDGHLLVTGSYNWSDAAETKNFENAVFIHDSATVSSYQNNFVSIWNTR
jgi:HKD family nuclease